MITLVARTSRPLLALLAGALLPVALRADGLYYRVFRGFKLATISAETFPDQLAKTFIPAAPRVMAKHSLVGYVPALPPREKPAGIPDEIAIDVYGSREAYEAGAADPERKSYGDLHWEYFERPVPAGRTRSDGARPFDRILEPEVPVDVLGTSPDWQSGYTAVYVGTRKSTVPAEDFLPRLSEHIARAREAFSGMGLDGHIVVANPEGEIMWMHWSSREAANAAFASPAGQRILASGKSLLETVMWQAASSFADRIDYRQAVTVPFAPTWRPPAVTR